MKLLPPRFRSPAFKLSTLAIAACVGAGIVWTAWLRSPKPRITDQDLLREAIAEWDRAGEPGQGPNFQIFEQQAAQGYYDDAAATGHLFKRPEDVQWSIVELAKIRAENGDVQGAKAMIKRFAGSDLGARTVQAVALAQVGNGDLRGALETAAAGGDSDEILLAFARHQIANGNFSEALKTAEQMKSKSADQVFYEVGDGLREQRGQKRVRELASGMSDRKLAEEFTKLARFTLYPSVPERVVQATPCDIADDYGSHGKFAEADALIEQNKCTNVSFVAVRQYAVDPLGAEHLLRGESDPQDLLFGLGQLAVAAAKKGDITEALRFLGDLQNLSIVEGARNPVLAEARNTEAVQEIARSWTIRDGPKPVLYWARSRPTTEQRTWALLGMAEALGHARPR
jgi:hypothetical protein